MIKLHTISSNKAAIKKRKRVGRGPGSGYGKTSGRGIKGQTSRSGVAIKGFEGGQMPIHMRMPKRGFRAINSEKFRIVSLKAVEDAHAAGKISSVKNIDEVALKEAGIISKGRSRIKVLGRHSLTQALSFRGILFSKAAHESVISAGGQIESASAD